MHYFLRFYSALPYLILDKFHLMLHNVHIIFPDLLISRPLYSPHIALHSDTALSLHNAVLYSSLVYLKLHLMLHFLHNVLYYLHLARPRSTVGRAPLSQRSWFDTRSGHILSFLLPLIQEGQLSVTGESMCTKYWLTA